MSTSATATSLTNFDAVIAERSAPAIPEAPKLACRRIRDGGMENKFGIKNEAPVIRAEYLRNSLRLIVDLTDSFDWEFSYFMLFF